MEASQRSGFTGTAVAGHDGEQLTPSGVFQSFNELIGIVTPVEFVGRNGSAEGGLFETVELLKHRRHRLPNR